MALEALVQTAPVLDSLGSCCSSDVSGLPSAWSCGSLATTAAGYAGSCCSTACEAGAAGAWSPPLRLQEVRVPKHAGPRGGVETRYRVQPRCSGTGGFGQVFKAADKEVPGRRVAVKKISLANAASRRSFFRERDVLKQLDHPCICRVLETYENPRSGFVVLELCQGGDVFDKLTGGGPYSEASAANILRQVASALQYAHGKGIAHRDVKPENVCFCSRDPPYDRVKLVDWGTAFDFRSGPMQSTAGSAGYAAPEVFSDSVYSEACDMWSLGATAYMLLCGRTPFPGADEEVMARMQAEEYALSGGSWDGISDVAKDFIRALLRADPQQRLTAEEALRHPFLEAERQTLDIATARLVFDNMRRFDASCTALSMYAVQVARHLDEQNVRRLQDVFECLERGGRGELSSAALRRGFEQVYGAGSEELRSVDSEFVRLDLDGSGSITFTEFCAVSLGGELCAQDEALQAAFRDFGVKDRCRQEVLRACSALADLGLEDDADKPQSDALVAWLQAVRSQDQASQPLELLRPARVREQVLELVREPPAPESKCPPQAAELAVQRPQLGGSTGPKVEEDDLPQATIYSRLCGFFTGRQRRARRGLGGVRDRQLLLSLAPVSRP